MPAVRPEIGNDLIAIYQRAAADVQRRLDRITADPVRWRERRRLRDTADAIEQQMVALRRPTERFANRTLTGHYLNGANAGWAEAGGQGRLTWAMIDSDRVEAIAGRFYRDMLDATDRVTESTKRLVRVVARDELLGQAIIGRTAVQAGDRMAAILDANKVHAVRYADGSLHGIGSYSQMAVRTASGNVYNEGMIAGARRAGVDLFEVFDGPGCGWEAHLDGEIAHGRIVTGDEAATNTLSHPNCRRAFGARPDLSAKPAGDYDSTVTAAQRQAQLDADQAAGRVTRREVERADSHEQLLARREARLAQRQQILARRG